MVCFIVTNTDPSKTILQMAKFAKGDWKATIHHFEELTKKFPKVEFLGISCDPKKDEALKILKKANGDDYGCQHGGSVFVHSAHPCVPIGTVDQRGFALGDRGVEGRM